MLAIDVRKYEDSTTISVGLVYAPARTYTLKAETVDMPLGTKLFLKDKFLNTILELKQGDSILFDVTADTLSQGEKRLELITQGKPTSIATHNMVKGVHKLNCIPTPQIGM